MDRRGLAAGAAAYGLWGVLPLYFPLVAFLTPVELVAHRVVWSLVLMVVLVTVMRGWRPVGTILRDGRTSGALALAAALVAVNWTVFVYAVTSHHTVDASLGYFMNPIVTIALAVLVLGERLRPLQWLAVGVSVAAVVVIWAGLGSFPWIAVTLAASFGCYGLVTNRVGPRVTAVQSLTVETAILTPVALAYLVFLSTHGAGHFASRGVSGVLLVMLSGLVTGVPLLLFADAARRIQLAYIGMLQYLAPILQFIIGVAVFGEAMPRARWIGFALVWVAVTLLVVDAVATLRRRHLAG